MVIAVVLLFSCGPSYHLKRAKRHIALAGELGAQFKQDTTWKKLLTPRSVSDTTIEWVNTGEATTSPLSDTTWWVPVWTDTIVIETTKWKTRTKFDTVTKTIYQQVECKPDTIRVPISTSTEITAMSRQRDALIAGAGAVGMLLLVLVSMLIRRGRKN